MLRDPTKPYCPDSLRHLKNATIVLCMTLLLFKQRVSPIPNQTETVDLRMNFDSVNSMSNGYFATFAACRIFRYYAFM